MVDAVPYLSIVTTSRNDNHGGHLLERMQLFINSLEDQCRRYKLKIELIIVEWNPPEDNKRLYEVLEFPMDHEFLTIRIIVVPKEIHSRFEHSDQLPLFQMIGKNVGIRRALGRFIVASNVDIVFSDELFKWLSKKEINTDILYRIDRLDVARSEWFHYFFSHTTVNLREYCKKNVIRINKKYGTFPSKKQTGILRYYLYKSYALSKYLQRKYFLQKENKIPFFGFIHTNGCGDFTLMSKDLWYRFMAYPELEMFSWNIDSLLLIFAYHFGVKEIDLPLPLNIYHMEHDSGSGWTPGGGEDLLFKRLEEKKIPIITWEDCTNISRMLDRPDISRKSIFLNKENWGLADIELEEKIM
ncbi:MAG: hypothetical protein MUO73_01045 [Thermoplasmata archaeon]|nr:hypothetical protein [Thermoplasmata archaeon]